MNIFQEAILDRLIGAQHHEFDQHQGPLGLAFQALADARLIDGAAEAEALGYPKIFSSALDAACTMLKDDVEQQRQLEENAASQKDLYQAGLIDRGAFTGATVEARALDAEIESARRAYAEARLQLAEAMGRESSLPEADGSAESGALS